jgi:hypothetical protein
VAGTGISFVFPTLANAAVIPALFGPPRAAALASATER